MGAQSEHGRQAGTASGISQTPVQVLLLSLCCLGDLGLKLFLSLLGPLAREVDMIRDKGHKDSALLSQL